MQPMSSSRWEFAACGAPQPRKACGWQAKLVRTALEDALAALKQHHPGELTFSCALLAERVFCALGLHAHDTALLQR